MIRQTIDRRKSYMIEAGFDWFSFEKFRDLELKVSQ